MRKYRTALDEGRDEEPREEPRDGGRDEGRAGGKNRDSDRRSGKERFISSVVNYQLSGDTDLTDGDGVEACVIGNVTEDAYTGRWTEQTATTASWPKATAGYTRTWLVSNRYVEDGSYLKLKYITLAYDWMKPAAWITKIRFSLTANNLFTITNYSWFDPDVNAGGNNAACPGVDSYSYPSARSFTFGLNFVF